MGACAPARLTPEIAAAASSSLFLLSPRDSGPPRAQSLSGEGRQQPRMWGQPSPLPLCLSLAALSSQLGSGAHGEEGNLCEGQHVPWTTCWPLPKGSSPPCAPLSDTEAWEPQTTSGKSIFCRPRFPTYRRTGLADSEQQQVPHIRPSQPRQPHSRLPGPLLSTWDGASHPGRGHCVGNSHVQKPEPPSRRSGVRSPGLFKNFFSLIYLRDSELLSAGFLSKHLQQPGLGQDQSLELQPQSRSRTGLAETE